MLRLELLGQKYSKTAHRNALIGLLPGRSSSAIERKHQNISAILLELGAMPIQGYKPLSNYQSLLFDKVAAALGTDQALDDAALRAVERPAETPRLAALEAILVPPPRIAESGVRENVAPYRTRHPIRRDYIEREARNRTLGLAGEALVMEFEAHRLHKLGKGRLADRIEQVSQTQGDGCGFDVLSFDESGQERFIEVKTTAFTAETPFYLSKNEVQFSSENNDKYWLYRVFRFRDAPKMFQLDGSVKRSCILDPVNFQAIPA